MSPSTQLGLSASGSGVDRLATNFRSAASPASRAEISRAPPLHPHRDGAEDQHHAQTPGQADDKVVDQYMTAAEAAQGFDNLGHRLIAHPRTQPGGKCLLGGNPGG